MITALAVTSQVTIIPAGWWGDVHSWAILLGVLAPLLTGLVNQPTWPKWARQIVALVVAVVLGGLDALANGDLTHAVTVLQVVAIVAAASWTSYKTVTGHIAGAIERATSPAAPEPPY